MLWCTTRVDSRNFRISLPRERGFTGVQVQKGGTRWKDYLRLKRVNPLPKVDLSTIFPCPEYQAVKLGQGLGGGEGGWEPSAFSAGGMRYVNSNAAH